MKVDWTLIAIVAVMVLAAIEWAKKPFETKAKDGSTVSSVPSWVWWILALPVSIFFGALFTWLAGSWIIVALMAFALATLAKDNIISLIKSKIDSA